MYAPAANSFEYFCKLVLRQKIGRIHKEWISAVETDKNVAIMAPRGHFKTTILSISFPLWVMFKEKQPKTFLLVSASLDQSTEIMGLLKRAIESNDILNPILMPDNIHETKWSETQIRTKNEHRAIAVPLGDSARGKQADYCISDDILKAEVSTDVEASKRTYYGVIYPTTQARRGKHIVVGTPVSYTDLIHELGTKDTFKFLKYSAVITNPDGSWKEPLFPEHFDLAQLKDIYNTMPKHLWAREYMCTPISEDTAMFPQELLQISNMKHMELKAIYDNPTLHKERYLGCDIAVSEGAKADYSVFTCIEKIPNFPFFLREYVRGHFNQEENIRQIEMLHKRYDFDRIIVEQTGVGWGVADEVVNKSPVTKGSAMEFDTKRASKERILSRLELAFRYLGNSTQVDQALAIPQDDTLLQELSAFGYKRDRNGIVTYASLSQHDDCVMSLAIALEAAASSVPVSLIYV